MSYSCGLLLVDKLLQVFVYAHDRSMLPLFLHDTDYEVYDKNDRQDYAHDEQ